MHLSKNVPSINTATRRSTPSPRSYGPRPSLDLKIATFKISFMGFLHSDNGRKPSYIPLNFGRGTCGDTLLSVVTVPYEWTKPLFIKMFFSTMELSLNSSLWITSG